MPGRESNLAGMQTGTWADFMEKVVNHHGISITVFDNIPPEHSYSLLSLPSLLSSSHGASWRARPGGTNSCSSLRDPICLSGELQVWRNLQGTPIFFEDAENRKSLIPGGSQQIPCKSTSCLYKMYLAYSLCLLKLVYCDALSWLE